MSRCWAILTGAYPPAPGGVSDYTRIVAEALAHAGDQVHVFTPTEIVTQTGGVQVHPVSEGYTLPGLGALDDSIDRLPARREILVQYTPQAFASVGANLLLPLWLLSRRETVTVMFHEVMHPIRSGQPLRHNLMGAAHLLSAALLARSATRLLVSTPRWGQILAKSCGANCPIDWTPVPSNLPTSVDPARVAALRASLVEPGHPLIGHFGTYGPLIAPMLEPLVIALLRLDLRSRVVLIGRGSRGFCERIVGHHPAVADRLLATGAVEHDVAAEQIAACNLLVQPYPDGVTARRGSIVAGLALGRTVVTNVGELTESIWSESGAVELAPDPSVQSMISSVERVLRDSAQRRELEKRAKMLYRDRFAVEHTVRLLRGRMS